jgi:hypothetical protein
MREPRFKSGQVVVFSPEKMNQDFWGSLSEEERVRHYGYLGYGQNKMKHLVYICPVIAPCGDTSHCVVLDMDTKQLIQMVHESDLRLAKEEEF